MDNQILSLYAKGMATREIAAAFKALYDAISRQRGSQKSQML